MFNDCFLTYDNALLMFNKSRGTYPSPFVLFFWITQCLDWQICKLLNFKIPVFTNLSRSLEKAKRILPKKAQIEPNSGFNDISFFKKAERGTLNSHFQK